MQPNNLAAALLAHIDHQLAVCDDTTPGPWCAGIQDGDSCLWRDGKETLSYHIMADVSIFAATARSGYPAALRALRTQVEIWAASLDVAPIGGENQLRAIAAALKPELLGEG